MYDKDTRKKGSKKKKLDFKKQKKIPEEVLEFRDEFIQEHTAELYEHTVTLCHEHHLKLHSIYGKDPSLATAKKQEKWVEIQRSKHGMV